MRGKIRIAICKGCKQPFWARSGQVKYCPKGCKGERQRELDRLRWEARSPERRRAGNLVQAAIRNGVLVRGPCEVCGDHIRVDAHHDDYSKPLAVRWLCRSHHKQHHNQQMQQGEA